MTIEKYNNFTVYGELDDCRDEQFMVIDNQDGLTVDVVLLSGFGVSYVYENIPTTLIETTLKDVSLSDYERKDRLESLLDSYIENM